MCTAHNSFRFLSVFGMAQLVYLNCRKASDVPLAKYEIQNHEMSISKQYRLCTMHFRNCRERVLRGFHWTWAVLEIPGNQRYQRQEAQAQSLMRIAQ